MQLTVDGDGSAILRTPLRAGPDEISRFLEKQSAWLLRQRAKATSAPLQRELVSGAVVAYLGADLTVAVESVTRRGVSVRNDGKSLRVRLPQDLPLEQLDEQVRRALTQWYTRRAAEVINELVRRWTPFSGKAPSLVLIRNQKRRWGSCASDGSLRFNWRLAMASRDLIEYVVVHELAHLTHKNHGPSFWAEVSRALPDFESRRAALRAAASELTL